MPAGLLGQSADVGQDRGVDPDAVGELGHLLHRIGGDERLHGGRPVSYTHLDVYKRQGQERSTDGCRSCGLLSGMRASSEEQPTEALSRRGSEQVVGFAARAEEDCVPGLGKVVGRGYRIIQVGAADDQRPAVLEGCLLYTSRCV